MSTNPSATSPPSPPASRRKRKWALLVAASMAVLSPLVAAAVYVYGWKAAGGSDPRGGHWAEVELGRSYLEQGEPNLALMAVQNARDEQPGAGEAMTVAGLALIQLKQPRYARIALERALQLQPRQLDAARTLANLYTKYGNGPRAVETLRTVTELDPKDLQAWELMGRVCHDIGEPAQAAEAFEHAVKLAPETEEYRVRLIADLLNSNQAEKATPYVTESLRRFPKSAKLLGVAARHAHEVGRDADSKDLANRALELDSSNADALLARARLETSSGEHKAALADLERLTQLNPNDLGALQLLAQAQSRLGLADQAAKTIERHHKAQERMLAFDKYTKEIAAQPDSPEPRFQMGRLAAESGQLLLASHCFKAALALDPQYKPAKEALDALPPVAEPTPTDAVSLPLPTAGALGQAQPPAPGAR